MILIFDTETTGFFHGSKPLGHPDQPYIVQIAAELYEEDGTAVAGFNFIVHNPGVAIPDKAAAVHGITTEKAERLGVAPIVALDAFGALSRRAKLGVAHNAKFDRNILNVARARRTGFEEEMDLPLYCTMDGARQTRALSKAPNLAACIQHFFGEELVGAHDAMVDVRACARVYFHLKSVGLR